MKSHREEGRYTRCGAVFLPAPARKDFQHITDAVARAVVALVLCYAGVELPVKRRRGWEGGGWDKATCKRENCAKNI
jgi:hypothetical protein